MVQLEGMVFHSVDIDSTSKFYETLLRIRFKEEKHQNGPKHYAGHLENGTLLEIYPLAKGKSSAATAAPIIADPSLIFKVNDLENVLETMKEHTRGKVEMIPYGAKIYDPDGRRVYLHRIR